MRIRTRRKAGKLALVLLSYSTVWWVCLTFLRVCGMQVSRRLVSVFFFSVLMRVRSWDDLAESIFLRLGESTIRFVDSGVQYDVLVRISMH
jgi:hypothetical protein